MRAVARAELRTRWRSLVVVGLLAGLVAAVVGASTAVARRTATAYDRLSAATHLDDARVLIFSDAVSPEEVEALPGVESSWRSRQVIGQVVGGPVTFLSVSSGQAQRDDLFTPVVVEGRRPVDDRVDEVMVPEVLAREAGIELGDRIPLKLLTPLEVTQFDTGFGEPDGPELTLKVVGVVRVARDWVGNGVGPVLGTPALAREYEDSLVGENILLRLTDGAAGSAAVARGLDRLQDRAATDDTGREFGVLQALYPTTDDDPAVRAARHTLVTGLLVFLVIAAAGGLLAVGQALSRHHAAGAADQELEAALGLTRAERVLARTAPALLGATISAVLAAAGALLGGLVEPLGPLRAFEPDPGWLPDLTVVALSAVGAALAFLLLSAATAARVVRAENRGQVLGSPRLLALPRLGRAAPVVAGLSFALRGNRGPSRVPVRATALVAVVGIAGVVAVASFAASLDRLTRTPERYGWVADFSIVDAKAEDAAALAADPRVAAVAVLDGTNVTVDGRLALGASVRKVVGDVPLPLLSGRLPTRAGETALGSREARRLGAEIGDRVVLRTYDDHGRRVPQSLRVVGIAVTPDLSDEGLGAAVLLWPGDLRRAARTVAFPNGLVEVKPGVDVDALYRDLSARLEMGRASQPAQVRNLAALGRLPAGLAVFLAVIAVVVLAHSLVLTVRRRSAELAVLRVIGLTPRQVAASVGVMAATLTAIGLVAGPVLGLAIGRVVWWEVAQGIGVAGDLALPWWLLVTVAPVALAVSALVVLVPARRAATLRPAAVLRSE